MKEIKGIMKEISPNNSDIPSESEVKAKLLKLRRLEDFDNSVFDLDYSESSYPINMSLKWKGGLNNLYIHVKVKFEGLTRAKYEAMQKPYKELSKNDLELLNTSQDVYEEDNYFYNKEGKKDSEKRKDIIIEGIKMWNGSYPRVFKNDDGIQQVNIICTTKEVHEGNAITIIIPDRTIDDISNAGVENYIQDWGRGDMKSNFGDITMFAIYKDEKHWYPYTTDNYKHTAKHEFGHVLGLWDAYTNVKEDGKRINTISNDYSKHKDIQDEIEHYGLEDITIDCSTYKDGEVDENNTVDNSNSFEEKEYHYTNMVMNKSTGKITNNDIEMVIRAWTSRKRQKTILL